MTFLSFRLQGFHQLQFFGACGLLVRLQLALGQHFWLPDCGNCVGIHFSAVFLTSNPVERFALIRTVYFRTELPCCFLHFPWFYSFWRTGGGTAASLRCPSNAIRFDSAECLLRLLLLLLCSLCFLLKLLANFLSNARHLQAWLLYFYTSLALRENILKVNGSDIRPWY